MTIASGIVVGNIYYNQPLLSLIASEFKVGEAAVSKISVLTQVGYALGLLLIVPLGDKFFRKRLILIDLAVVLLSLIWMCLASSVWMLYVSSLLIGITSVVPQLFVPMAAELSAPEKKSGNIGMVMSGLLIGILMSRTLSGIVGDLWGWRAMFGIAAVLMVLTWFALLKKLPDVKPNFVGSYASLMKSVWQLAATQPVLRLASFRGAMGFAGMSAVFTTLVFHLEQPPFMVGPSVVGSFGLVGAVGALAAAFVGRFTKRYSRFAILQRALLLLLSSWLFMYFGGNTYIGLIIGIVILDLGLQSTHIMNQTDFFSIKTKATNRLNTVYMVSYFIGGSLGTWSASLAWQHYGWTGVCVIGFGCNVLAFVAHQLLASRAE